MSEDSKLTVDFEDLTFGEAEEVEEIAGVSMDTLGQPGAAKQKLMTAVVFVSLRRGNPDITIDEVRQMKMAATVNFDNEEAVSSPLDQGAS